MKARTRHDLTSWYVAAAVFWFEALGLLGLLWVVGLAPLGCGFGEDLSTSPAPENACTSGEQLGSALLRTGVTWAGVLLAIGVAIAFLWVATRGHRRSRGLICLTFGLAALTPIVLVAAQDPASAFFPLLWTGVPSLLLLGSAARLLAPTADTRLGVE